MPSRSAMPVGSDHKVGTTGVGDAGRFNHIVRSKSSGGIPPMAMSSSGHALRLRGENAPLSTELEGEVAFSKGWGGAFIKASKTAREATWATVIWGGRHILVLQIWRTLERRNKKTEEIQQSNQQISQTLQFFQTTNIKTNTKQPTPQTHQARMLACHTTRKPTLLKEFLPTKMCAGYWCNEWAHTLTCTSHKNFLFSALMTKSLAVMAFYDFLYDSTFTCAWRVVLLVVFPQNFIFLLLLKIYFLLVVFHISFNFISRSCQSKQKFFRMEFPKVVIWL